MGVIYTRRATEDLESAAAPPDRHTVGVDLDLYTSRFLGDKNFQFEAFYIHTTRTAYDDFSTAWDRSTRGIRINFPNDLWRVHCSYREFGDNYDPAVGFNPRNGFRRVQPSAYYSPRPKSISFIRQFSFGPMFEYLTDLENQLLTRRLELTLLDIRFESGDSVDFKMSSRYERLDEEFEISDGIVIPVDVYTFNDFEVSFESARQRAVSTDIEYLRGRFWSGDRTGLELGLTVRPASGIRLSADWEQNKVSLPEGEFRNQASPIQRGLAVQPVDIRHRYRAVRQCFQELRSVLSLPMDSSTRKRSLLRVHAKLVVRGGRTPDAEPRCNHEDQLHPPVLADGFRSSQKMNIFPLLSYYVPVS